MQLRTQRNFQENGRFTDFRFPPHSQVQSWGSQQALHHPKLHEENKTLPGHRFGKVPQVYKKTIQPQKYQD